MRTLLFIGLLLSTLSVHGEALLSPQYDANHASHTQEYLGDTITFELGASLNEGILAYANRVAHGNVITVASSNQGLAIYKLIDGSYQLLHEISKNELGLQTYQNIDVVAVADNDKWLMFEINNTLVSLPLDQQYQPLLQSRSEINSVNTDSIIINNGIAVISTGYNIGTFFVNEDTGALSSLSTLDVQSYNAKMALANGILVLTQRNWQGNEDDLLLYKLDENNQWQYVNGNRMAANQYGYYPPNNLAFSPDGQTIIYGNQYVNYILSVNPDTAAITAVTTSQFLTGYFDNIRFLNSATLLVRDDYEISLFDSTSLQSKATFNRTDFNDYWRSISANSNGITILSGRGLTRLTADMLTASAQLQPGEQDKVLNFSTSDGPIKINANYLLQRSDANWTLFKLDEQGLPQLIQKGAAQQLFGHEQYYYQTNFLQLSDDLLLFIHGNLYSIIKLDTALDQISLVRTGSLTGRNGDQLYVPEGNLVHVGDYLVVGNYDTLSLFQLTADHQLVFVDAAVNGASGVTGIESIQLLFAAQNTVFAVDYYNQKISSFNIENNKLNHKATYNTFSFPQIAQYTQHNDVVTLISDRYLQSLRVAQDGTLTMLSAQFMPLDISTWVNIGERFAAVRAWPNITVMELDSHSGIWHKAYSIDEQQMNDDFNITPNKLLPLGSNLGIYDSDRKRLVRLSHNSAPMVNSPAALRLAVNQGQAYQLDVNQLFSDEEQSLLNFSLENADNSYSLSDAGILSFNGNASESGSFDLIAQDTAGLSTLASMHYQLNLAPIAKTTVPVFDTIEGDDFTFELTQYFTDPEGQALQYSTTSSQSGISVSSSGLLSGTLSTAGEFTIAFNITDFSGATAQHAVIINVEAKPKSSSGGSFHWLLTVLLASLTLLRIASRSHN